MKIRNVTISDLSQLTKLFEAYRAFYNKKPDSEGAQQFLSERIINNESTIYVAENESGQLAGFVQLYPYFSSTNLKRLILLNDLFVAPEFRGNGISVQLIEKAQRFTVDQNAHALMLETGKENDIGNRLYPKTGFKLYDDVNFYEWLTPNQ